jgi:hypothetical protein
MVDAIIGAFNKINESVQNKKAELGLQYPTLRRFISEEMGYPLEKHVYATKDGYLNTVFRIPGCKGETCQSAR